LNIIKGKPLTLIHILSNNQKSLFILLFDSLFSEGLDKLPRRKRY